MKYLTIFLTLNTLFFFANPVFAQLTIAYEVNTNLDVKPISPYIYGINGQDYAKAKSNRQGGNRMTGYNWENNASHAGEDYMHSSDNFLPFIYGIPAQSEDKAGEVLSVFVDAANSRGQYALVHCLWLDMFRQIKMASYLKMKQPHQRAGKRSYFRKEVVSH